MTAVPRVTIGLPVYNGQNYLSEALDALLDQTYTDFELIISDNASTDRTEEICRRYAATDPRIRYIRQPRNIGAAPNHNFVLSEARGELFKWAAHDDLYGPDLLTRCVEALDEHPETVLSHTQMAVVDETGEVVRKVEYTHATDSPHAPERFWSLLVTDGGDDEYAVIRTDILRQVSPCASYHNPGRTMVAELALHGPFHQVPELLYFRRDHPERGDRLPTVKAVCINLDPRRAGQSTARLIGAYFWGFVTAIRRAPLSAADRFRCYRRLGGWLVHRALGLPAGGNGNRVRRGVLRVGFCGILGSGNLGNDGSLDAVVAFLRDRHPEAELGFLCMGPERVAARYDAAATPLQWYEAHSEAPLPTPVLKVMGRVLDTFRTLAWVRRYDVVIVPGMGVLEATLPLRPWALPYSLLCLCASARLVGTRVALVGVGANVIQKRLSRWVVTRAASLAHYRSYRDDLSRDALREMGVDVTSDEVYPDLAFALPIPPADTTPSVGAVGVGVMSYYGGDGDRKYAGEIHRAYVDTMKRFVRWLVDAGRQVRLFTGDKEDDPVLADILADLRAQRPDLDRSQVVAEPASDLRDLMRQIAVVDTVVATRYHNVLCALKLSKPTLSLGYAAKNDVLMARMGLAEFCQAARAIDFDRLIGQFETLESRREELVETMAKRNRANLAQLDDQFTALSATLFPEAEPFPASGAGEAS